MASPLKGREAENHKYVTREWKNDHWVYYYDAPKTALSKTRTSSPKQTTSSGKNIRYAETGSWVEKYKAIKNHTSSALPSETVETGKKAIGRTGLRLDYSMTAATIKTGLTEAQYEEKLGQLREETDKKKQDMESHYNSLFESEKSNHRQKLLDRLEKKYGSDIPDEEKNKVDKEIEAYSKKLWDDVYQPLVDKSNKGYDDSLDYYDKYMKRMIKEEKKK